MVGMYILSVGCTFGVYCFILFSNDSQRLDSVTPVLENRRLGYEVCPWALS